MSTQVPGRYEIKIGGGTPSTWEYLSKNFSWEQLTNYTWEELLTPSLEDASAVEHISIRRDIADVHGRLSTGRCDLVIDNSDGKFYPAGGEFEIRPGLRLSVSFVDSVGNWHGLFYGTTDDYEINPTVGNETITISARDEAFKLKRNVNLGMYLDTLTTSLASVVASEAGMTHIVDDQIDDTIPYSMFDGETAGTYIDRLKNSGAHYVFVDGEGNLNFRHRNSSAVGSLHTLDVRSGFLDYSYSINRFRMSNDIEVKGTPRFEASSVSTIAVLDSKPEITPGGVEDFFLDYVDPQNNELNTPANSVIKPQSGTDYTISDASSGGSAVTTNVALSTDIFAKSAKVTVTNSTNDSVYLTQLGIRGKPLRRRSDVSAKREVDHSIEKFGNQYFTVRNDLIPDVDFANGYADYLGFAYSYPKPDVDVTIKNQINSGGNGLQNVQMDLFEQAELVHSKTAIVGSEMVIHSITHDIRASGNGVEHATSLLLRPLQKSTGINGLDNFSTSDPDEIFILDLSNLDQDRIKF